MIGLDPKMGKSRRYERNKKGNFTKNRKELTKHLLMAVIVIWAVVIFVDYPKAADAFKDSGKVVIENVRHVSETSDSHGAETIKEKSDGATVPAVAKAESESDREGEPLEPHPSRSDDSIAVKIALAFPNQYEKALSVFKCESGLDPKRHSEVDLMADGRAFSVGLAQINLTVSNVGGVDCTKAFLGKDYKAKVIDEELYKQCVKLAEDPDINLEAAKKKQRGNWGAWKWCDEHGK